tara:strand:+ start:177 stop:1892 length:1716 start_codon:yes stop_codon:yes gene_type:complete
MKIKIKHQNLLEAVKSVQTLAGRRKALNSLTHITIETTSGQTAQLSARSRDLLFSSDQISTQVIQPGKVTCSLEQLGMFLRESLGEEITITRAQAGIITVNCGKQTIEIETIIDSDSIGVSLLHRVFRASPSVIISLLIHLLLAIYIAFNLRNHIIEEDKISVDFVSIPETATRRMIKKPVVDRIQRRITPDPSLRMTNQPKILVTSPTSVAETVQRRPVDIQQNVDLNPKLVDQKPTDITTQTRIPMTISPSRVQSPTDTTSNTPLDGAGLLSNRLRAQSQGRAESLGIASMLNSTGAKDSGQVSNFSMRELVIIPKDKLGAKIVGSGNEFSAHIKLVRLKHSLSDWWQDPTAVPSFIKWLQDNTKITADVDFEGGSLSMTDERILDAPFIFMTGHDRDIVLNRSLAKDGPLAEGFSRKERIAMRKYLINRGGLLFFDDCGFNGNFASRFRRELQSVLPEFQLANIPHDHKLYKVYYQLAEPPTGGDVFWNSGYKPKPTQFKFQKGIFIGNRLAVVFNRKDYLCCMETSEVDSRARLQDRRSPDVHRFMTNLLVYAMKYGGNTDRSEYKR